MIFKDDARLRTSVSPGPWPPSPRISALIPILTISQLKPASRSPNPLRHAGFGRSLFSRRCFGVVARRRCDDRPCHTLGFFRRRYRRRAGVCRQKMRSGFRFALRKNWGSLPNLRATSVAAVASASSAPWVSWVSFRTSVSLVPLASCIGVRFQRSLRLRPSGLSMRPVCTLTSIPR